MRSNVTGVGHYNSEYRNFNRGFGRGNSKPFQRSQRQPSPQPTRKSDLFIEAGRLAVEYLVSHGLLSSNVLSGKWQNSTSRNCSQESKDHRCSPDNELPNSPVNGRPVVVANQGAATSDRVYGFRKPPVDDDRSMSKNSLSERRKIGASRSNNFDWSRENIREVPLCDKVATPRSMEGDDDKNLKDTTKGTDTDVYLSRSVESASNDDRDSKVLDERNKCHPDVDSDSKVPSMFQNKVDEELPKHPDMMDTDCQETKDGISNLDMEKETSRDKLDIQHCEETSSTTSKDGLDLLKLCATAKIPTKVRSSLINKNPKNDSLLVSEEQSTSDTGHDSLDCTKDVTMNGNPDIPSSNEIPNSHCVSTALSEQSFRDGGALDPAYAVTPQKPLESVSFVDKAFSYNEKSDELPEVGISSSFAKDRGEKRALEEEDMEEGAKKSKQWLSVAQSDEYSQLSDLSEKQSILSASRAATVNIFNSANQENFANVSLPIKEGVESAVDQGGEKQLFTSSFKICDLNLMETSEMHDGHDVPSLLYPSISAPGKDTSVGIDLSMNNNCSLSEGFNESRSTRTGIEIIDLESESLQEGKSMPARSMEAEISSMGSFPNNSHNLNNNSDGQDGYGFMISELLGNDDPNCSSVQPDINSLHNDMGLHHGEGMFSEDDPIYMSLGEIPISLLRVWEQPPQERNPFEL